MDKAAISKKASFDFIRYASVWEDADILCEALAPSCQGGRILSIASSGDNVLAMLTIDPKEIVAADLSQAQLACVELRIAAFRKLDYDSLLAFLGVTKSDSRTATYQRLRADLSEAARNFWDQHKEAIEEGIIHAGKFERYLKAFGKKILPWIHSKKKRESLLLEKTIDQQKEFYNREWDTFLWRLLFRIFFSKIFMGKLGRDPAFFDHAQGAVSERILTRTQHALTELATHSNPYLTYIITGNYQFDALPRYLRPEFKDAITSRLDRISLVCAPVHQTNRGYFDGYNLSDIFEYMDEGEHETCYKALLSQANFKARLVYWNMLVPRQIPPTLRYGVKPLKRESEELHWKDKAWFYHAFHVDEITSSDDL